MVTCPYSLDNKVLEVRDSMTHIPVLAIRMLAQNEVQDYYIHSRMGYPRDGSTIAVIQLNDCDGNCDPYAWPRETRTMQTAHQYIYEHFDELNDGDVVDVEFILGETATKKVSERITDFEDLKDIMKDGGG
jgi:hypothetical protein